MWKVPLAVPLALGTNQLQGVGPEISPHTLGHSFNNDYVIKCGYLGTLMTFGRSSSPNLSEVFLSLNFVKLLSAPMSWGYISSNLSSLRSGRSSRIVAAFWKNVNPILFHSGRRELLRFLHTVSSVALESLGKLVNTPNLFSASLRISKNACAVTQRKCQPLY